MLTMGSYADMTEASISKQPCLFIFKAAQSLDESEEPLFFEDAENGTFSLGTSVLPPIGNYGSPVLAATKQKALRWKTTAVDAVTAIP